MEEFLRFHAALRLPQETPPEEVEAIVAGLLSSFSLEKCAASRIGDALLRGISGGEKRRLSIASEVLTKPHVLLVDEVTTGLDATSAKHIVAKMEDLSAKGITIVMSIHQPRPDIFAMMSHVLLLSGTGCTVFSGAAGLVEGHFLGLGYARPAGTNAADFVLDTVIKAPSHEVAKMIDTFQSSEVTRVQAQQTGNASFAAALAGNRAADPVRDASKRTAPLHTQVRTAGS